jgi:beta-aspartyl-peptidase (threonine type)
MPISILTHGGAGSIAADDDGRACGEGCLRAARAGHAILKAGGSALPAVEAAVAVMEDDPRYNAGTGGYLNTDGVIELDASIMRGADLAAGAVAGLRGFKNPIQVARAVMDSPHVLFAGEGAARFARGAGFEPIPEGLLLTDKALRTWNHEREHGSDRAHGTVGAVAIDAQGHVAAATSTGGTSFKLAGRVGDSPLIGAGTYADDEGGAASATGHGEAILRVVLSKHAVDRMRAGDDASAAARSAVAALDRVGGQAGIILVDRAGRIGWAFNTARMSRGWIDAEGREGAGFEP